MPSAASTIHDGPASTRLTSISKRAYAFGKNALYCTSSLSAVNHELSPALEAWMARVCDELQIDPHAL